MADEGDLYELLKKIGWKPPADAGERAAVQDALEVVAAPRFCGVSEHINIGGQNFGRWPEDELTYCIRDNHPSMSADKWRVCLENALDRYHTTFKLDYKRVADPRQAHILFTVANLGGPGGVLADAQLVPFGLNDNDDFQSLVRFDRGDNFVEEVTGRPLEIVLSEVALHELGHVHGGPHIDDPNSLMNPTYNPATRGFRAGDMKLFKMLGYEVRPAEQPNKPDGQPGLGPWGTRNLRPGQIYTAKKRAVVVEEL